MRYSKEELEKIQNEALMEKYSRCISTLLFNAQRNLEAAAQMTDGFEYHIELAQDYIDKAVQLHQEYWSLKVLETKE